MQINTLLCTVLKSIGLTRFWKHNLDKLLLLIYIYINLLSVVVHMEYLYKEINDTLANVWLVTCSRRH